MKAVAEIVDQNQISAGLLDHASRSSNQHSKHHDKNINYLFLSFGVKYGHRWASLYPDEATLRLGKAEWSRALQGVDPIRLRKALDQSITTYPNWPPTIGEFLQLSEPDPSEANLPSIHEAWMEICREGQPYSHGVILAMVNDPQCDSFNWKLYNLERALKLFKPIYNRYISRALSGEQYELPTMIEDKVGKPATWDERKALAASCLDEVKEALKK